jgi:hypothetical protein
VTKPIEPMIQRHTGDIDAVITHVGEIGKPQPSWRMLLPEDDVLLVILSSRIIKDDQGANGRTKYGFLHLLHRLP